MRHTHIGVYGIIRQENNILLIKKARGPYSNLFDLPGGKIEFGETPEQALIREINEETGQIVKEAKLNFCDSVRFQHRTTNDGSIEDLHHIGIIFDVFVMGNNKLKISTDGLDSNGSFWFDLINADTNKLTPFAKKAVLKQKSI